MYTSRGNEYQNAHTYIMISLISIILNKRNDFVISYKPEHFHKKDFLMLIS